MSGKSKNVTAEFSLRAVSEKIGSVRLCGELPLCSGKALPVRYYRRLEQLLCRRCKMIPQSGELLIRTELYYPDERLCSVHVEAQLRLQGKTLPFFTDGCVWELQSGQPVEFRALTGYRFSVRKLLPLLEPRREAEWLLRTCPGWKARAEKSLSAYRFYLEPNSIVFYFPPLTLDVPLENASRLPFSAKQ